MSLIPVTGSEIPSSSSGISMLPGCPDNLNAKQEPWYRQLITACKLSNLWENSANVTQNLVTQEPMGPQPRDTIYRKSQPQQQEMHVRAYTDWTVRSVLVMEIYEQDHIFLPIYFSVGSKGLTVWCAMWALAVACSPTGWQAVDASIIRLLLWREAWLCKPPTDQIRLNLGSCCRLASRLGSMSLQSLSQSKPCRSGLSVGLGESVSSRPRGTPLFERAPTSPSVELHARPVSSARTHWNPTRGVRREKKQRLASCAEEDGTLPPTLSQIDGGGYGDGRCWKARFGTPKLGEKGGGSINKKFVQLKVSDASLCNSSFRFVYSHRLAVPLVRVTRWQWDFGTVTFSSLYLYKSYVPAEWRQVKLGSVLCSGHFNSSQFPHCCQWSQFFGGWLRCYSSCWCHPCKSVQSAVIGEQASLELWNQGDPSFADHFLCDHRHTHTSPWLVLQGCVVFQTGFLVFPYTFIFRCLPFVKRIKSLII